MKNIILAISATINAMFILAILVAFRVNLITIDEPQRAMSDEQYLIAMGEAGKEAKADIFSVLDKKHK